MIPILYDRYSQLSSIGTLGDCLTCTVTEQVNGVFECEFTYPITGRYCLQMMEIGGMIRVASGHSTAPQYFDIYKYSAPVNGIVTFYCSHVSYRLANVIVGGSWTATTPNEAMDYIEANLRTELTPFTLSRGGPWDGDSGQVQFNGFNNVRAILLNREQGAQSFLKAWTGEFVFDNFNVYFSTARGGNYGVQIRYGKNMSDVLREKDTGGIVSQIFPFWKGSSGTYVTAPAVLSSSLQKGQSPWTTPKTYGVPPAAFDIPIETADGEQIYFRPAVIRAAAVDFSDSFETQPTAAQLQSAARTYMRKNSTWRAVDNISVSLIDLYGTPEYEDIKELEECHVGDYVAVYYEALGIKADNVEIVSATYDALAERYITVELSTIRTTLAQTIIDYIGRAQ